MKYRYILFLPWTEYASVMYADLYKVDNVTLIGNPFKFSKVGKVLEKIYRIQFLSRFRNYIPFKSLWNSFFFSQSIAPHETVCFIFFMSDLKKSKRCFFDYLKEKYPGSKFVMYFEDTVQSRGPEGHNSLDFEYLHKCFDLVLSYDKGDCKKYGFKYYPTPYSKVILNTDCDLPQSDLFFCGMAKERHDVLIKIYKSCIDVGLNCDFLISSLPKTQIQENGIFYFNGMMSYSKYLEHLNRTHCILEINQKGADGFTLRTWEALVYGKKIITNNKHILDAPFYNPSQFCYIEDVAKIPFDFITNNVQFEPRYVNELSPIRLIEYIDYQLKTQR